LNKAELINSVAEKTGLSKKDAGQAVDAFIVSVTDALQGGEKVQLVGFGTFEVRAKKARPGRNPQTGEAIQIPATQVPVFKGGKALKDAVAAGK